LNTTLLSGTDWKTFSLPAAALTDGVIYHLVIQPSGAPTGSVSIAQTSPLHNLIPYDQYPDPQWKGREYLIGWNDSLSTPGFCIGV
jgi:hypothetical protein